jgi:NitT/TauT family transport system substrate-binding protein
VAQSANFMDGQGRLRVADIYKQVAWYNTQGMLESAVDPEQFLDLTFVQGHFDVPER